MVISGLHGDGPSLSKTLNIDPSFLQAPNISTTNICVDQGCARCLLKNARKCIECKDDFGLVKDQCIICRDLNCVKCDGDPKICRKCQPGFGYIVNGFCGRCNVAHCEECPNDPNICTRCDESFRVNAGGCELCGVPGCGKCDANVTECTECAETYSSVRNNRCELCRRNGCAKCPDDPTNCTECVVGFPNCTNNTIEFPDDFEVCITGVGGCVKCVKGDPRCLKCDDSYYLDNGACQDCADVHFACNSCTNDQTCTSCVEKYKLFTNGTKVECARCTVDDCKKCDGDIDICEDCLDGYRLNNGQCSACRGIGCKKCPTSARQCDECKLGYRMKENGRCQACSTLFCAKCDENRKTCDYCKPKFGQDGTGLCRACDDAFCAACYQDKSKCTECLNDFTGLCTLTSLCELDPNCVKCKGQNICAKCLTGFRIINGKCSRGITECIDAKCKACLNDADVCTSCQTGFVVYDNKCFRQCSAKVQNCAACQVENKKKCAHCKDGFKLNKKGKCVAA